MAGVGAEGGNAILLNGGVRDAKPQVDVLHRANRGIGVPGDDDGAWRHGEQKRRAIV
jgi:hypothetical protein